MLRLSHFDRGVSGMLAEAKRHEFESDHGNSGAKGLKLRCLEAYVTEVLAVSFCRSLIVFNWEKN